MNCDEGGIGAEGMKMKPTFKIRTHSKNGRGWHWANRSGEILDRWFGVYCENNSFVLTHLPTGCAAAIGTHAACVNAAERLSGLDWQFTSPLSMPPTNRKAYMLLSGIDGLTWPSAHYARAKNGGLRE